MKRTSRRKIINAKVRFRKNSDFLYIVSKYHFWMYENITLSQLLSDIVIVLLSIYNKTLNYILNRLEWWPGR